MKIDDINSTSITSLSNWKKSYKKCPHCGSQNTEVDTNCVLTTSPCQYSYHCKECNKYFASSDLCWVDENSLYANPPLLPEIPQPSYPTGWVCPKCGAVMSPTQNTCIYCSPAWTPTVTYGSGGSISGSSNSNTTVTGTGSNGSNTQGTTATLDEDYLKEFLKNNK